MGRDIIVPHISYNNILPSVRVSQKAQKENMSIFFLFYFFLSADLRFLSFSRLQFNNALPPPLHTHTTHNTQSLSLSLYIYIYIYIYTYPHSHLLTLTYYYLSLVSANHIQKTTNSSSLLALNLPSIAYHI